jgi:hypothetical protein
MKGALRRTVGGYARVNSDWVVNCHIECGFTVSSDGIRFAFPIVIDGVPFNYYLEMKADTEQTRALFNNTESRQEILSRAQESFWENLPIAIREAIRAVGEAAMFSAGVPVEETKAGMVKRLQELSKGEVVRQLKQKPGKAKIPESEYPKLLERDVELCATYQAIKRDHNLQYRQYCKDNHTRAHNSLDWQKVWGRQAMVKYGHLPLRFVELLADGYTGKQVARKHLADEFGVSVSTLERFILPRAKEAKEYEGYWYIERM